MKQFEDIDQRELRSKSMKQSWKEGKIAPNINSINESKQEKELRKLVKENVSLKVEKKSIKANGKYYLPDIIIDNKIIVEFFGDYWHAHHEKFKPEDIVHHGKTAKEIRQHDKKRITQLKKLGYVIHIVWQRDFETDKNKVLKEIKTLIKSYGEDKNIS